MATSASVGTVGRAVVPVGMPSNAVPPPSRAVTWKRF